MAQSKIYNLKIKWNKFHILDLMAWLQKSSTNTVNINLFLKIYINFNINLMPMKKYVQLHKSMSLVSKTNI